MTNEERIVRYFDNELTKSELKKFEEDLLSDSSLKTQFDEFSQLNNLLISSKITGSAGTDYFKNLVSRFRRNKVEISHSFGYRKASYALTTIVLLVAGYFLITSISTDNIVLEDYLTELSDELDDTEAEEILRYTNEENDQNDFADLYFQVELKNLDELANRISNSESELLSEFDINEFFTGISNSEADLIYNDLVNKNF